MHIKINLFNACWLNNQFGTTDVCASNFLANSGITWNIKVFNFCVFFFTVLVMCARIILFIFHSEPRSFLTQACINYILLPLPSTEIVKGSKRFLPEVFTYRWWDHHCCGTRSSSMHDKIVPNCLQDNFCILQITTYQRQPKLTTVFISEHTETTSSPHQNAHYTCHSLAWIHKHNSVFNQTATIKKIFHNTAESPACEL